MPATAGAASAKLGGSWHAAIDDSPLQGDQIDHRHRIRLIMGAPADRRIRK
jgi:uncharacterized protein YqiB (DUF1249 family)